MLIEFLGTAGPGGWPEPGCACASCASLPEGHRRPTEIVLDGVPLGGGVSLDGGVSFGPDAGGLLFACGEAPFEVVVAELDGLPERLASLRRAGQVSDATQVLVVGIDHRVRSEEELARRLAHWGARAVPDGTVVDTRQRRPAPRPARRTLLLGGSRSGKSGEAELRLAAEAYVTYVATGPRGDDDHEWRARVEAHQTRRPAHWSTLETTELAAAIEKATTPLLVDGLGTWVASIMWTEPERLRERCDELVAAWRAAPARIVAVSDEVGLGVVPSTASGRAFRDAVGTLNQRLATESEDVALVVAGRLMQL